MAEYIEREKMLELLENRKIQYPMEAWQKCGFEGGWHDAIDEIEDDIKSIPAADVAPVVHAYWTEKRFPGGGFWDYSFVCSHCHHETPVRGYTVAPDYCPNCGAKMDGKDGEQK